MFALDQLRAIKRSSMLRSDDRVYATLADGRRVGFCADCKREEGHQPDCEGQRHLGIALVAQEMIATIEAGLPLAPAAPQGDRDAALAVVRRYRLALAASDRWEAARVGLAAYRDTYPVGMGTPYRAIDEPYRAIVDLEEGVLGEIDRSFEALVAAVAQGLRCGAARGPVERLGEALDLLIAVATGEDAGRAGSAPTAALAARSNLAALAEMLGCPRTPGAVAPER